MGRTIASSLNIGQAFTESVRADLAEIARAGDTAGKRFSEAAKLRIREEFAHFEVTADARLNTDKAKDDWKRFKEDLVKAKDNIIKVGLDTTRFSRDIAAGITDGVRRAGVGGIISRLFSGGGGAGGSIASDITSAGGAGGGAAAAGTAAAAGGGGGGLLAGVTGWLGGLPWGIIGILTAASPFIAQVLAGAVAGGLGLGIASFSFVGALKNAGIRKEFASIGKQFSDIMGTVGQQFVPIITPVLKDLSTVMKTLQPFFSAGAAIISLPMQHFLDTLVKSLATPQVENAITNIATAFASILTAMTPDVAGGMASMADSISRIADSISKNPKAFANFINFLFQVAIFAFNATAALADFANFLEKPGGIFQTIENFVEHPFGNAPASWTTNPLGEIIAALGSFLTPGGAVNKQLLKIGGEIWHGILSGIDAAVKDTGKWITAHIVNPLINWMTAGFGIGSPAKKTMPIGHDIIAGILSGAIAFFTTDMKTWFTKTLPNTLTGWFSGAKTWLVTHGSDIISGLWSGITSYWDGTVRPYFLALPGKLKGYFLGAINWLWDAGWNIASGIGTGIGSFLSTIDSTWVQTHIFNPLKKAVFSYFGMGSPAKKTQPWGANIITGIVQGMVAEGKNVEKFAAKIFGSWPKAIAAVFSKSGGIDLSKMTAAGRNLLQSIFGSVAAVPNALGKAGAAAWKWLTSGRGGVAQWANTVSKALSMLKLPQSLTGQVLYQIQTESGGNPNAINLWDSNARAGNPSRGLLQTTGTTFSQYHVPGTAFNIYDPLANIAAAINYAVHRYGRTLMHGGAGLGSGHGYDTGGWLPPGVTMAINNTGRNELVLSPAQQAELLGSGRVDNIPGNDGNTYVANFDGLTGQAIEGYVRTAFHMMNLTAGNLSRPGRRS
jgi:hypothetical protein